MPVPFHSSTQLPGSSVFQPTGPAPAVNAQPDPTTGLSKLPFVSSCAQWQWTKPVSALAGCTATSVPDTATTSAAVVVSALRRVFIWSPVGWRISG